MKEAACSFLHFGLIVTGETEREHLPKLFRQLMETQACHFKVIGYVGQRDPITSPKRKLEMVGSGKKIPDKDATEIGFPTRKYLSSRDCRLVILIDDLEHHRREKIQQVFDRYRRAFDTILAEEQQSRAAVHFLANMLEAYYFADPDTVNEVLALEPPLEDCREDVETIRNPKSDLKRLYPDFDEIRDGGKILASLDVARVLSHPKSCAWLRTLFAWCIEALELHSPYELSHLHAAYCLHEDVFSSITCTQLTLFGNQKDPEIS